MSGIHNVDPMLYLIAFGVIVSFLISAYAAWRSERTRKVSNYLSLVASHRSIWSMLFHHPELERVMSETEADMGREISEQEEMFVSFIVLNLSAYFEMMRTNSIVTQSGLEADVKSFFSKPIPRKIWEDTKHFHNSPFVKFVERALTN